jgi:hypothetical protein
MARTEVTAQEVVLTGLEPALTAANADGDIVECGATVFLWVDNASGGEVDVTIQTPLTVEGLAVAENVVAVPAGDVRLIGPIVRRAFGQPTGDDKGKAYVDFESVTTVTRAYITI